ncbi:MAG: Diadenosine hexaphosphate hydrolase [Chlamydiales bacterium]|nr:Diadenosine hexaphosphate hydrolase [Chlamydiales bacterium]MCH9619886.1 Diadenosine hexaphosphate hydrolase [Chlamydiales bacterium]MCH9622687.1 Diadenosine hexaphosphate hydrolase [Chlamydiales bacterium]
MIHCFGIIPLRNKESETLLVLHKKGHWAFPKGHPNGNESEKETAKREFEEETGLHVVHFYEKKPLVERYKVDGEEKTVTYFIAEVDGVFDLQEEEIEACQWLTLDEALEYATFEETKNMITCLKKCF